MIDNLNRQLIVELTKDGRASNTALARKLGINEATVAKRVETMLHDGLIEIKAVPDPFQMGYKIMALIMLDVDLTKVDTICAQIVNNPNVSLVVTAFGRFDVIIFAEYPELEMLYKFVREELFHIDGVSQVEIFLVNKTEKRHSDFGDSPSERKPVILDHIDRSLIEELRNDGRANYAGLAAKLGVSVATISRKIASLKKEYVIKITAVPDPARMGFPLIAYIGIRSSPDKVDSICSTLAGFTQVNSIMTLINGYEIFMVIVMPDLGALYKFIKTQIASMDGVLNIEPFIRAELKKRSHPVLDPETCFNTPDK
jgi:DNA-binding Lrp family transcriptional regulator